MIVVTGPTGQIGGRVVQNLLDAEVPVRVIVRDESRLAAGVRDRVEVVQGTHRDLDVVSQAFDGADAVFWLVPADPRSPSVQDAYVEFSRPAGTALVQRGVGHVVTVSALGRGTPVADHAGYVTASLAMDDLIAGTGVNLRALTMPSFMDNIARQAEPIKNEGLFTSTMSGDRKVPTCATRDIAAVAAALLRDLSWDGVAEVPVLGPEDLSFREMAGIMSEVLGRPVRFEQVPGDAEKERMMGFGMSDAMVQGLLDMLVAKDAGLDNGVVRTRENSTPTTFRQWCEDVLKPAVLS